MSEEGGTSWEEEDLEDGGAAAVGGLGDQAGVTGPKSMKKIFGEIGEICWGPMWSSRLISDARIKCCEKKGIEFQKNAHL